MGDNDKKDNSGIQVGGNFSMTGGAMAFGKNAKAVNKVTNSSVPTELLTALMTLRTGLDGVNLSEKGREVVHKKLDKLEASLKADEPEAVMTLLDELTDNLEMANVMVAQTPSLAQPFDNLKQWASSRSGDSNPHK
ncbi:MAG: hypothetical protein SFZ02_03520 [bacterium]|nr:hypothetical protein [bacterium]